MLHFFGATTMPTGIQVYPNNFEIKDEILAYLDAYNDGKSEEDQILYTDLASTMTELTGGIMSAITYVLIAFAGISLITLMFMIAIIIYTSVLERTKNWGLKSIRGT